MKLKKDFYACLPGNVYPETFVAGTECPQELLSIAKSLDIIKTEDKAEEKPAREKRAKK